jgi:hypothetical protein
MGQDKTGLVVEDMVGLRLGFKWDKMMLRATAYLLLYVQTLYKLYSRFVISHLVLKLRINNILNSRKTW